MEGAYARDHNAETNLTCRTVLDSRRHAFIGVQGSTPFPGGGAIAIQSVAANGPEVRNDACGYCFFERQFEALWIRRQP
jgi:hypothetical protein